MASFIFMVSAGITSVFWQAIQNGLVFYDTVHGVAPPPPLLTVTGYSFSDHHRGQWYHVLNSFSVCNVLIEG